MKRLSNYIARVQLKKWRYKEEMEEIISLTDIKFEYKDKMIFDNLSYCFNRGRYIIQGENGGGKSTLLNLLYGYLKPQSGTIKKIKKLNINYLFQDAMLFNNLTVQENILIKCIAINQGECDGLIKKYAQRYSLTDKLDKKVSLLSGGERQRVQLAILSCSKPDVILLDEPIANLDTKNSEEIMDFIFDLNCPLIIVVSHQYINRMNKYTLLELKGGQLIEV